MQRQRECNTATLSLVVLVASLGLGACSTGAPEGVQDTPAPAAPPEGELASPVVPAAESPKKRAHSHHGFSGAEFPGFTTAWIDEVMEDHPEEESLHDEGHVHAYQPPMPDSVRRLVLLQVSREARALGGLWRHYDNDADKVLDLEFTRHVGDVRSVEHLGLFLTVEFRLLGSHDEPYLLDFWVTDSAGGMKVAGARVLARPELVDGVHQLASPLYERDTLRSTRLPEKGEPPIVPPEDSPPTEKP